MGIKVSKTTPVFVENMSVVLKVANTGRILNKKTMALIYHFFREHVAKNSVEVRKIHNSYNFVDPFT